MQTYAHDMNDALQKHGHCLLPAIGLLHIILKPAERSYQENKLHPPAFNIVLDPLYPQDKPFFSIVQQIASAHSLSAETAAEAWSETASAIRDKLSTGSSVELAGLGFLNLDENGRIVFAASIPSLPLYEVLHTGQAKNSAAKPATNTAVETDVKQPADNQPEPFSAESSAAIERRQSRSRWWIAGSIIVLLLVGWFTYKGTMQRRQKASHLRHILRKDSAARQLAAADSLKLQTDTPDRPQPVLPDSIHYKIIFAVYNNEGKAAHQFRKMKNWGLPVVLVKKDSATYELGMPFTSMPRDTTVNLVKMMKLYGDHVHIEYDRENELK